MASIRPSDQLDCSLHRPVEKETEKHRILEGDALVVKSRMREEAEILDVFVVEVGKARARESRHLDRSLGRDDWPSSGLDFSLELDRRCQPE